MIGRTRSGCAMTSIPSITAEPESGVTRVVSTFTAVVLPAPFGPRSAVTVPCGTAKSRPSRAWTGDAPRGVYVFFRLSALMKLTGKTLLVASDIQPEDFGVGPPPCAIAQGLL